MGREEIKLALFADDIIFFSGTPLKRCLKVNATKSKLLVLAQDSDHSPSRYSDLPVTIASKSVKYLGILIVKTPESLYNLNYPALICKIVQYLEKWTHLPPSFLPICHLLKMLCFPKLLYPLQTIPLLIKHLDVIRLTSAFISFVWNGKRPRIAIKKLMLPKSKGGINLPDIRRYNLDSLLRQRQQVLGFLKSRAHDITIETPPTYLMRSWAHPGKDTLFLHYI